MASSSSNNISPTASSGNLELSISFPAFSSSPPPPPPSRGDQSEGGSGVKDLDINQIPLEEEEDMNQQAWISAAEDDDHDDNNLMINQEAPASRKKLRLSREQSHLLEESFRMHHTLNPGQKEALASQLKLTPRQVEVWFQNRRARSKLKQTEMECEYLKRWFGSLKEQNRRLQREVEELRSMKLTPPTVLSPHSCEPLLASTLSMCPHCERVSAAASSTTAPDTTTTSASTAPAGCHLKTLYTPKEKS